MSGLRRVMIAGDSMTQGADGDRTWRYHLWNHLAPHVQGLDFVGPYTAPAAEDVIFPFPIAGAETAGPSAGDGGLAGTARYRDPRFDREHNAVWGRTLAEAAESIEEEVRSHGADLLCVLIGVNDLLRPVRAAEMERRLRSYAAAARRGNPDLRIAAAESPPIALAGADPAFALRLRDYNALVRGVTADLCTDRSPVVSLSIADREGWDPSVDTRDGTHPSARGEAKIAAAFADTLSEEFGMGPAHPRPLTSPD